MYLKCVNKNYSFRFKLPNDIKPYFNNRYELILSLKTKDVKIAKIKALKLGADTQLIIEKVRFMRDMNIDNIDDEVNNWLIEKLERDYKARLRQSSLDGIDDNDLPNAKQEGYSRELLVEFQGDMRNFRLSGVKEIANSMIDESIDENNPIHKELMFKLLQANITLFSELNERNNGNFSFRTIRVRLTYEEAINKYLKYFEYKTSSQAELKAITSFMSYGFKLIMGADNKVGDTIDDVSDDLENIAKLPISSTPKIKAGKSKEELLEIQNKISSTTFGKYIKWVKGFFTWAYDGRYIETNVANNIRSIEKSKAKDDRKPLTDNEVKELLSIAKAEDEDTYTMLKILAYTGMIHSEFFKMKNEDTYFDVENIEENLKTDSRFRKVPKHSALLGITDEYIDELQRKYDAQGLSKLGMKILRKITKDKKKVIYSLRHSLATKLGNKGVEIGTVLQIMGHAVGTTMTETRYDKGRDIAILIEAINKLDYGIGED